MISQQPQKPEISLDNSKSPSRRLSVKSPVDSKALSPCKEIVKSPNKQTKPLTPEKKQKAKQSLKSFLTKPLTASKPEATEEPRPTSSDSNYKTKIRAVRHRVDCWNRSSSAAKQSSAENSFARPDSVSKFASGCNKADKLEVGMTEYIQIPLKKRVMTPSLSDSKVTITRQNT